MIMVILLAILCLQIFYFFLLVYRETEWINRLTPESMLRLAYYRGFITLDELEDYLRKLHENGLVEKRQSR